jgi:hypothetical protein
MVAQIAIVNAKRTECRRKSVARMVADKDDARVAAAFDQLERGGLIASNEFGYCQGVTY